MALIALFAVSTSLPALAVGPGTDGATASGDAAASGGQLQSITASNTAGSTIVRDGFTITEAPEPEPEPDTESAGVGARASLGAISGGWTLPIAGSISSTFGPRPEKPVAGVNSYHSGTDLQAPCGGPVFAAAAGTVVEAGFQGSYGNWVLIDHGNGIQTGYAHNSQVLVSAGEQVAAGANIALVGATGAATGCHVHFEARIGGTQVEPESFMSERGITLG